MTDEVYVIIGASLAGAKAAETLRAEGFAGRVVLIGEESELPYERPPLSKGYLLGNDPRDGGRVHEFGWYAEHDVELRLGTVAERIDTARRLVTLHPADSLHYDKLLLATGSRVRTLTIPGSDLAGVRYLRTLDQADALLAGLRAGGNVVVVGAGWIGLETAAAARHHGCSVTVVEMDTLPLRRVLGDEVASIYRDLHVAHGVDFRFGAGLSEFQGEDGQVTGALLADGTVRARRPGRGRGRHPAGRGAGRIRRAAGRQRDRRRRGAADLRRAHLGLRRRRVLVPSAAEHPDPGRALGERAQRRAGRRPVDARQGEDYAPVPYFFSDQYDLGMEYAGWVTPGEYDQWSSAAIRRSRVTRLRSSSRSGWPASGCWPG